MIVEVAILHIKPEKINDFEPTFKIASKIISSRKGYISHELKKCMENENQYILLVKWKELLHDFYEPFSVVEHYESVELT